MKKSQGQRNRNPAVIPAQPEKNSTPHYNDNERLAGVLKKRGFSFSGNSPRSFEMMAFHDAFEAAREWKYDDALAKLYSLSELISDNPRMAFLREAIDKMVEADNLLSNALAALQEI